MKKWTDNSERGVALIVALFALLLLSAVGLGMMYATNAETYINANFRDKQVAQYGSVAGIQEARDRIQPVNAVAAITAPTALPALATANVVYIINPTGGETIAPWDTSNKYFDTELCHENTLGLTGQVGVPCTATATGSTWYTVKDDSTSGAGPWSLTSPTSMKWTRLQVKGNNMGAVPVDGNAADATQVCWDGKQQIPLPSNYIASTCGPDHHIQSVVLTNVGSGYTSAPTVSFTGGGGSGAAATVNSTQIPSDQVGAITVTNGGSGYTSIPTVTIAPPNSPLNPGDIQATAVASIYNPGAPVASVSLTNAGTQCYQTAPTVTIQAASGDSGNGASATAALASTTSCIYQLTISANCAKNDSVAIAVTGGGGSGFAANAITTPSGSGNFPATNAVITNSGTGYNGSAITVTLTGSKNGSQPCTNVTASPTFGYRPASLTLGSGGQSYNTAPTIILGGSNGAGTLPTATATLGTPPVNATTVTSITITNPGKGYTSTPAVSVTGGGGTGAQATATRGSQFTLTDVTVTAGGTGYTSIPTVTITGGGGTGATAYATVNGVSGLTYGMVYLVTSLAQTPSGARAMTQSEIVTPVRGLALAGALTLDGPNPNVDQLPNSSLFTVNGNDVPSCGEPAQANHPAVGVTDDPNASPATNSIQNVTNAIPDGRTSNYEGSGPSPDVQNVFGALGDTLTSPTGLKAFIDAVMAAPGANIYGNNPNPVNYGTQANPIIDYVDGNLTLSGSNTGYGILLVTGTLTMDGNFSWNGLVLVIGDGALNFQGGGNGQINGSVIVAKIWDSYTTKNLLASIGTPFLHWNGGGGNGIQYDHCWADNSLSRIPFFPPPPTKQLTVISTRTLSY